MPVSRQKLIALLLAVCLHQGGAHAKWSYSADWPHLRGPVYDAVSSETGLANEWPADGPPILWTRELGEGYSGMVVVGGRVYTQFQARSGQFVICLEAQTGNEIWRRRVDWPWQPGGAYPGPYATPTWHADRIYYATPSGLVGCLNASDGSPRWSLDIYKKFTAKGTEFGYAATPLVEQGRVILPVGGAGASVVALNADDGSTVWAAGDDPASYCPLYPATFAGRRMVIAFLRNSLAAHDVATGEQLWRLKLSAGYDEHSAWPLYAEPLLMISAPFRAGSRLFQIEGTSADQTLARVWSNRQLSSDVCSSVLYDGHVYGFDLHQPQSSARRPSRGRFKCLDLATGEVRWETDKVGQATVLVADGKLVLLNDTGALISARATPDGYAELARSQVLDGGLCWTPPVLSNGRVFVRNHFRAACLFLGPPESLDRKRTTVPAAVAAPRFDWARLARPEPQHPYDPPAAGDLAVWFAWCAGGVFAPAGVVTGFAALLGRTLHFARPGRWAAVSFAVVAGLLGLVGTTVFSAWADRFILTWPASLYIAFRATVAAAVWAQAQPGRAPRWTFRFIALLFCAVCWGYYRLCMAIGYVMAWGFLTGFLPAAPATIFAARAHKAPIRIGAEIAGFTVYFWSSALLPIWKTLPA